MLPKPAALAALFAAAAVGWLLAAPAPPAADPTALAVRQFRDPLAGAELDVVRRATQTPAHILPAAGLAVAALCAAGVAAFNSLTAREGRS